MIFLKSNKYSLILASKSPRRKEILGWLGINFEILSTDIDEVSDKSRVSQIAEDIAMQKGVALYDLLEKNNQKLGEELFPLIVSSDTVVALGGKVYGKPKDTDDARKMLLELSGKTHKVVTAVYISRYDIETGRYIDTVFSVETDVTFKNISEDILESYLKTGDSLDKAGSYGIQGQGLTFISKVNGSYSNVVGFPIDRFIDELKKFLGHESDNSGSWKDLFL